MTDSEESAHSAVSAMMTGIPLGGDLSSCSRRAHRDMKATRRRNAQMSEAEGAPIQLSLFPVPAGRPVLRAPLFHVRCPECRAVNDVPSLPTICYVCRCPLGREQTW